MILSNLLDSFRTKVDFEFRERRLSNTKYLNCRIRFKCKKCNYIQVIDFSDPEKLISWSIRCMGINCDKTYSLEKFSNEEPFYNLFEE